MTPAEKIRAAARRLAQVAENLRDAAHKKQLGEIAKSITSALADAEKPPPRVTPGRM